MDYLICRDSSFNKVQFSNRTDIIKPIEYGCSLGAIKSGEQLGGNDFSLKVALKKNELIPLGYYICYGFEAEFAGQIEERYIDLLNNTVTYYGSSLMANVDLDVSHKKKIINSQGISDEVYTPAILSYDSSQVKIGFDEVLNSTIEARGTGVIYFTETNVNLDDTITVTDRYFGVSVTQTVIERHLIIDRNGTRIEINIK